ncbi:MAG: hypothetical protein JST62_08315 [Bacteroidetes bacterium]|nr:hypothetical protein [Bacteroidota bacterium]
MKKIIFLHLLLLNFLCSAQEVNFNFDFDYKITSQTKFTDHIEREEYFLINSKNHDFFLEMNKNFYTKQYYADIIDSKNIYRFDVENPWTPKMEFKMIEIFRRHGKKIFDYKLLEIINLGKLHYRILGKKRNKVLFEMECKLQPYEANLLNFNFEGLTFSQHKEFLQLLNQKLKDDKQEGNFYFEEIIFKYGSVLTLKMKPEKYLQN